MQVADLLHKHDEENTALGRTGSAMGRSPVGRSHGSSFSGAMSMEKPTSTTNVRCGIESPSKGVWKLPIAHRTCVPKRCGLAWATFSCSLYAKPLQPVPFFGCRESTDDLILEGPEDIEFAAYEAALIQDQNAKLSVFATRPAILNFYYNFQVRKRWLVIMRPFVRSSMGSSRLAQLRNAMLT